MMQLTKPKAGHKRFFVSPKMDRGQRTKDNSKMYSFIRKLSIVQMKKLSIVIFFLASCDNSLTPISENSTQYFSINGYLDTAADTQFVRIEPFRATFQNPTTSAKLDATATIQEGTSGRSIALRDSVIKLNDGSFGHLFYAKFKPLASTTYTLSVRKGNQETTAKTTTPVQPKFSVTNPFLEIGTGRYVQSMSVTALPQVPNNIQLRYYMATDTTRTPIEFGVNYNNYGRYVRTNQTWETPVYLEIDLLNARDRMLSGKPNATPVYYYGAVLTFETLDDEWTRRNQTPATNLSNVQNGTGFFGSVARWRFPWKLPPSMMLHTKLRDKQPK